MSVLADLLSKTKKADPLDGKGVPPTLVRAQKDGAAPSRQKKRFVIMSLLAVVSILVGLFLPTQIKRLSLLLNVKTAVTMPQPVKMPLPSRTSPSNAPEQIVEEAQKAAAAAQAIGNQAAGTAPAGVAEPARNPAPTNPPITSVASSNAPKQQPSARKAGPRPVAAAIPRNRTVQHQEKLLSAAPAPAVKKGEETPGKADTDARGALLYAARSSEQAGDWRGALASYRSALEIDPDNYRIMSNSAAAYNKLGMYADGEREARRALARKHDYIPALVNAAIACSSQGNDKDALKFFSAASAADPGNKSLLLNLGVMQERAGNLDKALESYRRGCIG